MPVKIILTVLLSLLFCSNSIAETMSVAFSGAEVRSAPTAMSSKVVFKANKFYPLTVIKESGEYYQVSDYRGRKGYIHKSLLKAKPSIVVTGDRANVRSGPGTDHGVVFQVSKGDSALLLSSQEGWVEIKATSGQTGWIADFLVFGE